MLTDERYSLILTILKEKGIAKTQDLMNALNCSESTIRRDLEYLDKIGKLKRIHGGAKRMYHLHEELSNQEKSLKNIQEKTLIGKYAASLIEKNDCIFLDAGTTTLAMIDFIDNGDITIVTNGILHASLLADRNIQSVLIGGKIKASTKAIVGATSLSQLKDYRFSKAFIGINGIDVEFGCTTPDPEEAAIKSLILKQSALTFALADETKWNKVNFVKVCNIEDVTIISNEIKDSNHLFREKTTILEAKE
ncbi:DeoR/GlpR family DNA-binding transcription regulator [Oceanobacillus bengalensis]|uniref:DeoR/GlpR transcriptional regulator n=1 Tax=Oceanobacillus bengalensis TaxID=1435466 RepID=A0A494YZG4_9BACI|nr:DeoR/GlpR family DNA-binding transcription regulator [Oceanobacillus bengalensis]RKQ15558.1 DeoR/GlpR transcriptional regulator [Oceanobacillus bengalensis]